MAHPPPDFAKSQKSEENPLILGFLGFSPNVDHCSKPRGYPQKIFSEVLTNMCTMTKKNINIFGGGLVTSKNIDFRHPRSEINQEACQKIECSKTHRADPQPAPIPKDHPY